MSEARPAAPAANPGSDRVLVEVHPGAGVIDRHEDVLLVIPEVGAHQWSQVQHLVDLWHRPGAHSAGEQERTLTALLSEAGGEQLPGLALLQVFDAEVAVLAYGEVEVTLGGPGQQPFRGTDARPWVRRRVPGSVTFLRVRAVGTPGVPSPGPVPFHLQSGTVPGSGITVRRAGPSASRPAGSGPSAAEVATGSSPDQAGAPQITVARKAVTFESVLLTAIPDQVRVRRPALPLVDPADRPVSAAEGDGPVFVDGVECPAGHFSDPTAKHCATCGATLGGPHAQTVRRPRPALGVLVTDHGSVFTLTGGYVIGRAPERDEAVLSGRAKALVLRDVGQSVSRVHAQLEISGWRVLVTDRGSSNGTFLSYAGSAGPWERVGADMPTLFTPGARLRIGGRQLLFESYREEVADRVGTL